MANMTGQTVTIDRAYFETILRRANFNPDDLTSPIVSISQSEYDGLKQMAAKYANLRQNLLRGGVGEETIDLLSQDDATIEQQKAPPAPAAVPIDSTGYGATFDAPVSPEVRPHIPRNASNSYGHHGNYNARAKPFTHVHTQEMPEWAEDDVPEEYESASGGGPAGQPNHHRINDQTLSRPYYERLCQRSLLLSNLAEGTTHGDITEAVRGGQLLDIYVRPHDRMATVAFLQAADARAFFDHVRRHDLYIKHKRVDIRWNDRQFILPGHVASKIGIGATRNLVIRRCDPRLTEAVIREDMEHIHNLVVIKVGFLGGSCYIKTNSVHNAMFAKTCLMSRLKYKHSKIDWDVDECCQPFSHSSCPKPRNFTAKKADANAMTNRFDLLNLDDDGDVEVASPCLGAKPTVGIAA